MFSGIVEATGSIHFVDTHENGVQVRVSRPAIFSDLKLGDSISCNGVCLTVEKLGPDFIQFTMAYETLQVLKVDSDQILGQVWNLERSLRFGDRVHGHLVTGHVEALGEVIRSENAGDSWFIDVKVPSNLRKFIWKKGSIALHGVSLTVNDFANDVVSVCLIPETVKRTNLSSLTEGQPIHVETDYLAKAYFQGREYEI